MIHVCHLNAHRGRNLVGLDLHMNRIKRMTGPKTSTGNPTRERGIAFPVGSVPRSSVLNLRFFSPEGDTVNAGAVRHRTIDNSQTLARRATQDFQRCDCVALRARVSRKYTTSGASRHRHLLCRPPGYQKAQLQNSRFGLRSRIASKKIGAAQ